jgi:hypothetical protein
MIFLNYVSNLIAGMKVEKRHNLSIVLTMIASFVLAFAYLYGQRIVGQRAPERQSAVIAAPIPVPVPGENTARSTPPPAHTTIISKDKSPVRAAPAAEATPAGGVDDQPLPVIFTVGTRPVVINDDEGPSRREIQPDGILLNSSDKRIALTVVEVNLPTMETTEAQLVLQPNGAMHFGRDWGLKMVSGDQLTLRAAGYQGLTQTIP